MSGGPDRLFNLLPVIYRERDGERGWPLRAVLRTIAQQVDVVEADIEGLYENWFIETCQDWVVPYIGDLIGYQQIHALGETPESRTAAAQALRRVLVSRRDVANTIRYRRQKGASALLELLANDVAGWPARVVEFGRLVGVTQPINHTRVGAAANADIGIADVLDYADGPFDRLAHTADVRRISSQREDGRYGLNHVGLFVWRLRAYSMTKSPAYLMEERSGDHSFTFNILGINTRLYSYPVPEAMPTDIAEEANLPVPIRRRAFEERTRRRREVQRRASPTYYGDGKAVALWTMPNADTRELELIPREKVLPADLSEWAFEPEEGYVAVDPVLGRIAFAPGCGPRGGLWVSYYYGFPADIGGGEYERTVRTGFRPKPPEKKDGDAAATEEIDVRVPVILKVGKSPKADYQTITAALAAVAGESESAPSAAPPAASKKARRAPRTATSETPAAPAARDAIIEIIDSEVYEEEQLQITVQAGQYLEIRAASGVRPVIRRVDWHANRQDDLVITLDRGSRFFLDGVMVSGRGLEIHAAPTERRQGYSSEPGYTQKAPPPAPEPSFEGCETRQVTIRHCTLVPGWMLRNDCAPTRPAEPSITLRNAQARLVVQHSIVGSIQVDENADDAEPIAVSIADSIVDATSADREAIGAPGERPANAVLRIERTTVIGHVAIHAIELAENGIFEGLVTVARKQIGCMRFCYVRPGSRTPRTYLCQPETAVGPLTGEKRARVERRIRPRFNSLRYGSPDYCQLAFACPDEIARGADDESEMGVYHGLYQPQRTTNLRTRLTEYVPAGVDVDIIFAS